MNYPMLPEARLYGLEGDAILNYVFARVNDKEYMYTGTEDGLVY